MTFERELAVRISRRCAKALAVTGGVFLIAQATNVRAQDVVAEDASAFAVPDDPPAQVSEARGAAAEAAYDRATEAYLEGDYARAAELYEAANDLAAAPASLIQAVRSYEAAGDQARAATLALALREQYGEARVGEHTRIVAEAAPRYFRLDVFCGSCSLEVDGRVEPYRSLFLGPTVAHRLVARFESGEVEQVVAGGAGEYRDIELRGPQRRAPTPQPPPARPITPPPPPRTEQPIGLSPGFVYAGAGLTALSLGLSVWSSIDTADAAREYKADPTDESLDRGVSLELRTDLLIATTGVLATSTAVLALFFTDWRGDEVEQLPLSIQLGPTRAGLQVRGELE